MEVIMKLAKICLLANMLLSLSVAQAGFLDNFLKRGLAGVTFTKAFLDAMDVKVGYRKIGIGMSILTAAALSFYELRGIDTDPEKYLPKKLSGFNDIVGEIPRPVRILVDYVKNPSKYEKFGVSFSKGILLSGAPGTGKTLLARAIAHEADVPFFHIAGQDILARWLGESELNIKALFEKARRAADYQHKPFSIIFIDEIDSIGRVRSVGVSGVSDEVNRVVNALITEMDGFAQEGKVIVIGATNMPKSLDPALMRSGRFNFKIEMTLPDKKGRKEIIEFYLDKYPFSGENRDRTIERLSEESNGFSPADIESIISNAALEAVSRGFEGVTEELLFAELRKVEKSEAAPDLGMLYS